MVKEPLLRDAKPLDIESVVQLWAEHVDFHLEFDPGYLRRAGSMEGFAQHLRSRLGAVDFLLLVAEIDGEVVGFLNGQLAEYPPCFEHRAHGFLNDLAVSAAWRRRGIGKALLEKGMAWFSEKGVPTVEGKVLLSNPAAMAFWQNTKFEPYMHTIRVSTEKA